MFPPEGGITLTFKWIHNFAAVVLEERPEKRITLPTFSARARSESHLSLSWKGSLTTTSNGYEFGLFSSPFGRVMEMND